MSILDDAIREHLELKRQHGADDAELKKLEDEAFGPPARPDGEADPYSEAPTEFLTAPGAEAGGDLPAEEATRLLEDESQGGRRINVADLQEPPPPPDALGGEAERSAEAEAPTAPEPPAEEEHPAMEHEAVTELPAADDAGPDTEERHAIAEQPTEMFDVEGHLGGAAAEASPSDEELVDAEQNEPRLAPVDPVEGIEASAADAGTEAPPSDEELEEAADEFDESREQLNFAEEEGDDEEPEHPAANHSPEHQDALEDTPEFLADDPEDENLWFEQKPPKDIDFGD